MKKILMLCLLAVLGFGVADAAAQKKGGNKAVKTTVFLTDIDGCEQCMKKVESTLPFQKGVKDVKIDAETKLITITYDMTKNSDDNLIKAMNKIKLKAEVAPAPKAKK